MKIGKEWIRRAKTKEIDILKISRGNGAPLLHSGERIFDDVVFYKYFYRSNRSSAENFCLPEEEKIISSKSSDLSAKTNLVSRDETSSSARLQSGSVPSVAMTLSG
ncbi:MAG: hypothetical protein LBB16_03715 [Puniceicoccales bacterium]|nr:hypothetical protein [Puniceicoccales bacterium]